MKQTEAIHVALKKIMRSRGRTYAQAARVLELSEASIKRLISRSELSLERLESLCDWLGVEIADVVAQSAEARPLLTQLTHGRRRSCFAIRRSCSSHFSR